MENVDYVKKWETTKSGRRQVKFWLTLSCFKDICQRSRGGETVRKFFVIAEKLLRDHTERVIAGRPFDTHLDLKQIERYTPENEASDLGSFAYLDHIRQVDPRTGKVYLSSKPGSTRDGPIRKIGLKRDQPGEHNFAKVYRDKHPEAFEELYKELSLPWQQRCMDHPTPTELEYAADLPEDRALGSYRNRDRKCET